MTMARTKKGGSRRGPSPPPKRIGNPQGANGDTMSIAKLSNRLDARQDSLRDIIEDSSTPAMDDVPNSDDEWAVGEWKRDSTERRYFSPHEEGHPLRYFGAEKYKGGVCPCQKGNEPACSFHYPNGHPSISLQHRRPESENSRLQENLDCTVCGGSIEFPCLKCTSIKNKK
jgi:hypothetical protein